MINEWIDKRAFQILHADSVLQRTSPPFLCFEKELLGPLLSIMAQAFEHLKWQSRLMLLASLKEPYNGAAAPWTRKLCLKIGLADQDPSPSWGFASGAPLRATKWKAASGDEMQLCKLFSTTSNYLACCFREDVVTT